MIPAETSINIYQFSQNGFVLEYLDDNGDPFDLTGFTSIKAALMLATYRNVRHEFEMVVTDTNKVSVTLTNEETQEYFNTGGNARFLFEIRFYSGEDFSPYTIAEVDLLNAYNPDGEISGATITVQGDQATTVSMTESSVWAALALNAKNDTLGYRDEAEGFKNDAQTAQQETQALKDEAEEFLAGAIVLVGEEDDYFEIKALAPSELVDGTETVGGYEIETVEIIQN